MNDELKHWIEETEAKAAIMLEAAKRAREGEHPKDFLLIYGSGAANSGYVTQWEWQSASSYALKPRRRLRPWTAKEWGVRIGDEFLVCGCKKNLKTVSSGWMVFCDHNGCLTRFTANKSDMETITQLDGSPCGELEEVAP